MASRMLLGQFVTLLSSCLVKYMFALCSLMFMALQKSFDLDVSQVYRQLCGLDCAGRGRRFAAHLYHISSFNLMQGISVEHTCICVQKIVNSLLNALD